jgi:protein gp37
MSKIEWTEKTWNPIVGCSIVSPGCTNCYAMKMAARLEAMARADARSTQHYLGTTQRSKAGPVWTGKVALAPERILLEPLSRKKPTTYFVNSMGDFFHESVPDAWIDSVFAVMALCPQHTFQVLTKRSARMRAYTLVQVGKARAGRYLDGILHDATPETIPAREVAA